MASVEKLTTGWSVRFMTVENGKTKRKRLSGFKTKQEALRAAALYKPNGKISAFTATLDACDRIIMSSMKENAPSTIATYKSAVSILRKLLDFNKDIQCITKVDLLGARECLSEMSLRSSSKNLVLSNLRRLYRTAYKVWGVEDISPVLDPFKSKQDQRVRVWSPEEFDLFLLSFPADDPCALLFELLYHSGLRIREALALTHNDLISDGCLLSITKSLDSRMNIDASLKNHYSKRVIPIKKDLFLKLYNTPESKGRIFSVPYNKVRRVMLNHCTKLGLPTIGPHGLRHTHASRLLSLGAPVTYVSARLGHANSGITLQVYAHFIESEQTRWGRLLEQV